MRENTVMFDVMFDSKQWRNTAVHHVLQVEMRERGFQKLRQIFCSNEWKPLKKRCLMEKQNLCKSGDSLMAASTVVAPARPAKR